MKKESVHVQALVVAQLHLLLEQQKHKHKHKHKNIKITINLFHCFHHKLTSIHVPQLNSSTPFILIKKFKPS